MNITQQGIITLLKSAITQQTLPLPEGFSLETAYPLIKRHHIVALACDGGTRCGLPAKDPVMQKLFSGHCRALLLSERQMGQVERIFAAFDEKGIDYMPIKGCKMKALYPKPELRSMGDADVLIRMDQYDRIVPIMESLGFAPGGDTDHELVWTNPSLYLELHKRLIPSYNKDFYAYFADGWQLAKCQTGTRYAMTAEDELLFLFTHFAKHYRDGGIGCRYVADLWVYLRANPGLDEAYIEGELEKLQLLAFYRNIRSVISAWFEGAPADEKTDFITDFIFSGGSWGTGESQVLSRTVRDSNHSLLRFSGKLVYLWETAFPGVQILKEKYTVLQKAPWMLPLVWIYRPFYKVIREPKTLKKQKKNLRAVGGKKMDTRRRDLQYVGLDYHF